MPARQNFRTSCPFVPQPPAATIMHKKTKPGKKLTEFKKSHSIYTASFKDFLGCNLPIVCLYSSAEVAISTRKTLLLPCVCFLSLHSKPSSLMGQDSSCCSSLHSIDMSCRYKSRYLFYIIPCQSEDTHNFLLSSDKKPTQKGKTRLRILLLLLAAVQIKRVTNRRHSPPGRA